MRTNVCFKPLTHKSITTMENKMRIVFLVFMALLTMPIHAASIWGATNRAPATGTMRFPVDTSSSSSPGYLSITAVNAYVWANPIGIMAPVNGGTGLSAAADDNVMVGNGTAWQSKAVPSCSGGSSALTYNTGTNAWGCNTISGTGTVTSVDVSGADGFSFTGGPITTNGTIAFAISDASDARDALGLEIGADVMGFDELLNQISSFPGSGSPGPTENQFVTWFYDDSEPNDGFLQYTPMPAGDVVGTSGAQTMTDKTLGTGTAIDLGSDATGDIYYRNSGGDLARLPIGSSGEVLTVDTGLPSWAAGGSSGLTRISKPSNTTRTSDTTLSADPHLQFAMAAGDVRSIRCVVYYRTMPTPDFKFSFSGPASPAALRWTGTSLGSQVSVANFIDSGEPRVNTYDFARTIVFGGTILGYGILEFNIYVINGSNAGTFSFNWAQDTSNAGDTAVLQGSYIEY